MKQQRRNRKNLLSVGVLFFITGQTCMAQGVNEFTGLNKPVKVPFA